MIANLIIAPTAAGRCTCCDLPAAAGCGTAALKSLTESDPLVAAYLTGTGTGSSAPERDSLALSVPTHLADRVTSIAAALAVYGD